MKYFYMAPGGACGYNRKGEPIMCAEITKKGTQCKNFARGVDAEGQYKCGTHWAQQDLRPRRLKLSL
jgi:hypothetical protein